MFELFESTGLLIGWLVCTYIIVQVILGIHDALNDANAELGGKLAKHLNDIIHRVKVEKNENTYYWYDIDDHEFLAQGASDEEIIANLKSRFPTHMFFLPTNHVVSAKTDWQPKIININPN